MTVAACIACLALLAVLFRPHFPDAAGEVASDYAYYFPRMFDGAVWFHANGPFAIPWFTPSFCGGLPAYPNPQNDYYSVPQLLDLVVGPIGAVRGTLLLFGALGFAGSFLLARQVLRAGVPASVFAASVFALNGLFLWRLIAGHLQFHPVMLVPLVAWATLARGPPPGAKRWPSLAGGACVAGGAIGYAIEAGALQHVPLLVLSVVAIALVHASATGASGREAWLFASRLTLALLVGVALAAGKLSATLSFLRHVPREHYPIPGVRTAGDLVELVVVPLLWRPRIDHLAGAIVNTKWYWAPSEFELGIGPVPLALLLVGAFVGPVLLALRVHRGLAPGEAARLARGFSWAIALALLIAAVLCLNVYPAFSVIEARAPFLRYAHAFFRYDAVLVPVLVFAGALVLDRLVPRRAQWLFPLAAVALLVAADRGAGPGYGFGYSAASVERAHERLARGSATPPIETLAPFDESVTRPVGQVASGESVYPCYEPMFGYLLETFPRTPLHPGPVTDQLGGAYNLLDPACFLFPEENRCAPGDRLRVADPGRFESFRAHRALPFERPWWQWVADATSLLTFAALLVTIVLAIRAMSMGLPVRPKLVP